MTYVTEDGRYFCMFDVTFCLFCGVTAPITDILIDKIELVNYSGKFSYQWCTALVLNSGLNPESGKFKEQLNNLILQTILEERANCLLPCDEGRNVQVKIGAAGCYYLSPDGDKLTMTGCDDTGKCIWNYEVCVYFDAQGPHLRTNFLYIELIGINNCPVWEYNSPMYECYVYCSQ